MKNPHHEIIDRIKLSLHRNDFGEEIYLHEPYFKGSKAYDYLKECIDTGWVSSSGLWVSKFEDQLKEFTGAKYVVAVSNGTVALRLALYLNGVKAEDEVITSPLSFVATANSIRHLGAFPNFVDIESKTLGMSPEALKLQLSQIAEKRGKNVFNKITGRKISAILPIHIFGLPCRINEIKEICEDWNIPLVEDSAEALGSTVKKENKNIHCGCFGEIGTLSFNGNKIITTGGGGALLTGNKDFAKLAKHLSTTAKVPHAWDFYHDQVGWNDRLPSINAAIGCSQLEDIQNKLKSKRILQSIFKKNFEDIKDVEILNETENTNSNYWLITLRLLSNNSEKLRNQILSEAHKLKIFLRPSWILLNKLPMYKKSYSGDLSQAIYQSTRLINLPSSPQLLRN